MNIYDEYDTYQGHYNPMTGIFTQSPSLASDAIRINQDVVETLRLQGCRFIETATVTGVHVEPIYLTFERFMEMSSNEWSHEKQVMELVYRPRPERSEPDERQEVRSNLH